MRILPARTSLAVFAVTAALVACEGGGPSGEELERALQEAGGEEQVALPIARAGDPGCEALAALPARQGALAGWLQSAHVAKSGSGAFVPPGPTDLAAFQGAFEALLRDGPSAALAQAFDGLGFELGVFADDGTGAFWLVLEEKAPRRGGGTFVVNPAASRDLWLEVPHAHSDAGTLAQGADQLVALGARALLVTGAHRCAAAQETACDGTTNQCGGALRVSDAAHAPDSYFMAAHRALRAVHPGDLAVNLHGMESAGGEAAVISDGTRRPDAAAPGNAIRDALNARLDGGRRAFSCNDPADGGFRPLCGTTNVQGRHDNGAADACTGAPTSSTGRFLHLEQDPLLRGAEAKKVIDALAEAVACAPGGQGGAGCQAVSPLCR